MKQNLLFNQASALGKRLAMVLTMLLIVGIGQAWGANFKTEYTYSMQGDSWSLTNCEDASSYWKVPNTTSQPSIACFAGIFSNKTITSEVIITLNIATFGNGSNPSTSKFTIYNSSDCSSQVTATQTGNLPTSSTYTNAIYTIAQNDAINNFTEDLAIKVASGTKQIRLKSITITFSYENSTPSVKHKAYFYNGTTLLNTGGTEFSEGAAVSYSGSTPTSCDGESTTFVGWATSTWDGKVAKGDIVPDFYNIIDGEDLPEMGTADVNYYAVFAKEATISGGATTTTFTAGTDNIATGKNGIKFTMSNTTGSSGYYQVYSGSAMTISSDNPITSFIMTCTKSGTEKYGPGNITFKTGVYSYSGTNGTWTGNSKSIESNNSSAQLRITKIVVTTSGGITTTYSDYMTSCTTQTVYSVTYDSNGATSGTVPADNTEYASGATVTAKSHGNLAKTGYTFIGWNTQADGKGTAYQSGETFIITRRTTLYAQWQANTYKVSFNANGGDGTMSDQDFTYDEAKKALSKNTFTRTGYTFNGWNTQANGQGTTYTDQQSVNNLTTENNATITLYAQWKIQTFTVTFNSNGGAGTMTSQTFTYNQAQTLTANAFTRTGYTFNGWNTQANGQGATYTDQQSVTLTTAGLTLYAQWKANTYTVKFDGNGSDSGSMNNQSFTYGQSQSLTANAFTRANYTFKNWNTKADGSGKNYTDKQSVSNLTSENGAIITLYAQWTPTYTITWLANGQEFHTQTAVEGTALDLPDSEPDAATYACNDKVFVGWTENQISGSTNTKPADLFTSKSSTLTTNATYYAVFADVEGVASTDYEKITDASDLTDGKYVIAYGYNTTTPSIILEATTKDATTLVATSASPSSNKYQNPAAENIWTIKKNGTTYTLYNETTSKYVQANTTPALLLSDANPTNFVIESLDSYWKIKISDYTSYQLVGYTNSSGNYFQTKSGVSASYKIQLYKNTSTQRFFNYSTNCIMTYVISFDLKGHGLDQKPEEQIVEENGTVTEPSPAPKAEGYYFGGWFTDSECTSPYDFSSPVTASFTLYAKWTAIEYTITYDNLNGGNNDANPKTYTIESETITLKNLDDTNTHHFVGWYDEDDNLVTKIPQGSTGDITLYAKWVEIFTVKWYANGKELTNGELGSASTIVYEGEHISNLPPSGNLNNYCGDFVGWTDAEMDVNNVAKPNNLYTQASEFPNATGNQEFFAVFAE